MKSALLVIDLQEDFFQRGRLKEHREELVSNVNQLVDIAHESGIPVIWVRQEYKSDLSDAPLHNRRNHIPITIIDTEGYQILHELHKKSDDYEVIKKRFSAFFRTDLDDLLEKLCMDSLIIAGINTMTCVRTTAIDAYQRDLNVVLALDCVDAHDVRHHENSLEYLQFSVSRGKSNPEIIAMMQR